VDNFCADPVTEQERVVGKFDNAVANAFLTPTALRGRVHIKAFGYNDRGCGPSGYPYQHGHFNRPEVPYWLPAFWHPDSAECPAAPAPRESARAAAGPSHPPVPTQRASPAPRR
jgi:hypothetical protein